MTDLERAPSEDLTVGLMYFSPTGTTRRVCEEIGASISTAPLIQVDLTKSKEPDTHGTAGVGLWVIGVPVYASRMPSLAYERIALALADVPAGTPAIAAVLYGNVEVGIGLKQLADLLRERGLNVIGAGEFIGEHYFKKFHGIDPRGTEGRPNAEDLMIARELGGAVLRKGLDGPDISTNEVIRSAEVAFKFRSTSEQRVLGLLGLSTVDPSRCTKCQACVRACPVGCIDSRSLIGNGASKSCLGCGNCLKVCPSEARSQSIRMKWLVKFLAKPRDPPGSSTFYV